MKRTLAALAAVALLTVPLAASASEVKECADGLIHVKPFCLSQLEFEQMWLPPTPPVDPGPVSVSPEALVRQLAYYYWPDWAAERMIRIAWCESRYSPTAQHPRSKAAGIWQIMPFHQADWPGDYFDPWTNAAVAYQIWLEADRYGDPFRPWVCKG